MYDYDAQYRRLKASGFRGWAGDHYDRSLAGIRDSLDNLDRKGLLPTPPARVLELGCGNGTWSFLLAAGGYPVHGVDISATAIAWAEERFAAAGLAGTFRQGSVCDMPFLEDGVFDIVVDGSCLHCLIGNDRARCLAEVGRILHPAGVFIVSSMCGLPKSDAAKARFDPRTGHLLQDGKPNRTLKPVDDIVGELAEAGFEARDVRISVNAWWDHAVIACRKAPPA